MLKEDRNLLQGSPHVKSYSNVPHSTQHVNILKSNIPNIIYPFVRIVGEGVLAPGIHIPNYRTKLHEITTMRILHPKKSTYFWLKNYNLIGGYKLFSK